MIKSIKLLSLLLYEVMFTHINKLQTIGNGNDQKRKKDPDEDTEIHGLFIYTKEVSV